MSYVTHQFNFTHIWVYGTTYVAPPCGCVHVHHQSSDSGAPTAKLAITANYVESCVNCLTHWYISSMHSSIAPKRNQSSNLDCM